MHFSVVIPAFNEAQRIGDTLRRASAYLSRQSYASEIIVVDDGSEDETCRVVEETCPNAELIAYRPNHGKGYAVKTGMASAKGAYRLMYDADASTPIEELEKAWARFEDGADVVIGSRSLPESDVQVRQSWTREHMGRMFNRFLRTFGLTRFVDTQCGFKIFTAQAAELAFPKLTIEGFSFDAEALYICARHSLRIDEVPVKWLNSPHSRVNMVTDSLRMLADIVKIRLSAWRGKYG